jgi:uncharacterized protein YabE (DUF348 family)/3D (Asp-Asp-Asp) domain-containing protein
LAYWLEGAPIRPEARPSPRTRSATHRPLSTSRGRLRLALVVCIAFAGLLAFVLFPAKRTTVAFDGGEVVLTTRNQDVATLLDIAGASTQRGDVVVQSQSAMRIERAQPVVVDVDGQLLSWRTRAPTVEKLLDEMDVEFRPYDSLLINGLESQVSDVLALQSPQALPASAPETVTAAEPALKLTIQRAVAFTIVEDGRPISLQSSRPTVAMALQDAGIKLGPADEVTPALTAPLGAGIEIAVKHAKAVSLRVGDSTRVIYTHKGSLKEALTEAGFHIGADDRVEPSIEAAVSNGMSARLVRVAGRTFSEREPVKRKTIFKPDESLAGFNTRTVQGNDGVLVHEYKVLIEDGVEREKTLVRSYMEPEVKDNVIYYAASTIRATGYSPENMSVAKTERMWATWYNAASSGKPATHPAYGITASGIPVTRGVVAVDPRVIPLGSRLFIPGYGFAVAADTGGGIVGNMLDLGFADGERVDWRTGWVDVYLLAP